MTVIDKILVRIANMCVLSCDELENSNLTDGKAAAIVYLYEYARHSGRNEYADEACLLLREMCEKLSAGNNAMKELAQAGIAANYLAEQGYPGTGGHVKKIFDIIKEMLRHQISLLTSQEYDPRFSPGLYMLSALRHEGIKKEVLPIIENTINAIKGAYESQRMILLPMTNSALLFTGTLVRSGIMPEKAGAAQKLIEAHIDRYLRHQDMYNTNEINVLKKLVALYAQGSATGLQDTKLQGGGIKSGDATKDHSGTSVKLRDPNDDLWSDMIFPLPGHRRPIGSAALEAFANDKLDYFNSKELPSLATAGLYMLNFKLGLGPQIEAAAKMTRPDNTTI